MTIARFEPHSATASAFAQVHEICARCHAETNEVEPYRPLDDTVAFLRHPPATEPRSYWTATQDDEIVGFAQLAVPSGSTVGEVSILVLPGARNRGVGGALFAAVAHEAEASSCTTLIGRHATSAGRRFADRLGATESRRDVRSLLTLTAASLACSPVDGYRLRSWTDRTPDELVASFAEAREAINDAPAASSGEWHVWDVEKVRDLEGVLRQRQRQIRVSVALDSTGCVVAYTELRVSLAPGAVATTEDTAVVRAHRGRGLAGWVKADALAALRRDRPDVELVSTTNAEANAAMLAVNKQLGFLPAAVYTTCAVELG